MNENSNNIKIDVPSLREITDGLEIIENEKLSNHTTFRVGGPAKVFVRPTSSNQIHQIISFCKTNNIPFTILGNGSNVLVADEGYMGVVIQIYNNMNNITLENGLVYAQAGALLSKVAAFARDNSLTGFEFAAGIPGTLGGAVVMNAGAYGGEIKNCVAYVDVLEEDGTCKRYNAKDMKFGYRKSIIDSSKVVLGAAIKLSKGNIEDINNEMDRLKKARTSKQPLEFPSAGSTFKRPEGYFAGKLIEDSGLAGYKVGGAQVSTKHCGFVINSDNATCEDIKKLIKDVQDKVFEKFQVKLETEVKFI